MPLEVVASGGAVLLLDQLSKRLVRLHPARECTGLAPWLRFRFLAHRDTLYRRTYRRAGLVLIWLAALASGAVLHLKGVFLQSDVALCGFGIALGGAAGNLIDILRYRYVVDFIDLGWWPVFNIADLAIVAGLILALFW